MKLGVIFPQTEIGNDPGAVREFAQTAEALGYEHILAYDHVLGADPAKHPDWGGLYTMDSAFHEPFVLFGYLAAITSTINLTTGIIILPQRQTALVAKQAAAVDVLSGGRMRLGVGLGWNRVEYEALGQDFHNRGRRIEEQVALLRKLWTEESVDFDGRWHTVSGAGINPMPVQRPIPIWMGGGADPVLRRVATLADGWLPQAQMDDAGRQHIQKMRDYAVEAGRNPDDIVVCARTNPARMPEAEWAAAVKWWKETGVSQLDAVTMGAGYTSPQQHIDAIRRFKEAADALG